MTGPYESGITGHITKQAMKQIINTGEQAPDLSALIEQANTSSEQNVFAGWRLTGNRTACRITGALFQERRNASQVRLVGLAASCGVMRRSARRTEIPSPASRPNGRATRAGVRRDARPALAGRRGRAARSARDGEQRWHHGGAPLVLCDGRRFVLGSCRIPAAYGADPAWTRIGSVSRPRSLRRNPHVGHGLHS